MKEKGGNVEKVVDVIIFREYVEIIVFFLVFWRNYIEVFEIFRVLEYMFCVVFLNCWVKIILYFRF